MSTLDSHGSITAERRLILDNTSVVSTVLVPEICLNLLKQTSPLWQAFEDTPEAKEIARPYWAFAWSGGQALARYILDNPQLVRGKHILDFGAGCGIAAIAAAKSGARCVTASDIDPVALQAVRINGNANHVSIETDASDLIYTENPGWAVVLAGDIWYDSRLAGHGMNWLRQLVSQGVSVISADPGRAFSPSAGIRPLITYKARSVPDLEHPNLQDVAVFRILSA
ncbi:MAG: methyltransferase [Desulfosarcina sp.]|nr:methyltransferase [Desulfosarcina sp.]